MLLDEHLAEILDFSALGYQRMTVTKYGIYRHSAMSSLTARCVEQLPGVGARKVYEVAAERGNHFGRVNAALIAGLPANEFITSHETLVVEMADGELSLRLLLAAEHAEDGFHVYCVVLHPEEIDAAMRHLCGAAYAENEDPLNHEL